ncbi:MAG: hypothetical protein AAGB26_04680 [Planctomycetota bacterium]
MSQPHRQDVIHSLELIQQVISEGVEASKDSCGGDCANCPCSGEAPKSNKKTHDSETSDPCDKC